MGIAVATFRRGEKDPVLIDGIKFTRISDNKEMEYIFTDMGAIDGEFVSKLEIDGTEYYSKVSISKISTTQNSVAFRFNEDIGNFKKYGFQLSYE